MQVKDMGEFGLIKHIEGLLPAKRSGVVVGIGDDVAVLGTSGPDYLLATCDVQVEGVHFTRGAITAYQLGRRVVAINVSDIAAKGGNPLWALVSLVIPGTTELDFIEELYRGMIEQAGLAGASIVGGNMSRCEEGLVIDLTLIAQIAPERLVLRSGARAGDAVLVTGFLGRSRAGLELLRRPEVQVSETARKNVLDSHFTPQPRLREGQLLASSGLVHAMTDVSDGLMADLGHICESSRAGAVIEIEKIPLDIAIREVAAAVAGATGAYEGKSMEGGPRSPADPPALALEWALGGGEDYELLFTASPDSVDKVRKMLLEQTEIECHEIGRITGETGPVRLVTPDGREAVLSHRGWDHYGDR